MNSTPPPFLPLLLSTVGPYTVSPLPRSPELVALYAQDNRAVAEFAVDFTAKATGEPQRVTVELYYRTDTAPLPYAYGRNGMDGGDLTWDTCRKGNERGVTELSDFDGDSFLPKSVAAVLRAHGLRVDDDCLVSPL